MDRKFILTGFGYAIIGLALGIYMAASKNHGQLVTHAHIMLLGFVVSFVYGVCHKLWLGNLKSGLASIQFYLHQTGTLFLAAGLFLLYGNFVGPEKLEPVLSVSSIIVLIALILMKIMMVKNTKTA
jgi:drug/metabolite transporter (DMT)-like permease